MKPSAHEEVTSGLADPAGGAMRAAQGSEKPCIILIDRRPLFREAVAHVLATCAREFSVLTFFSADEMEDGAPANAGVVIYNIGNALITEDWVDREIRAIATQMPERPLIVLCDSEDTDQIVKALNGGARGYILTSFSPTIAIGAIRLVHAGGVFVPATALLNAGDGLRHVEALAPDATKIGRVDWSEPSGENMRHKTFASLTPRQREILHLLREGQPNKNIAYLLNLKEGTVKVHIRQIFRKMNATNRTQLACFANRDAQFNDQL